MLIVAWYVAGVHQSSEEIDIESDAFQDGIKEWLQDDITHSTHIFANWLMHNVVVEGQ